MSPDTIEPTCLRKHAQLFSLCSAPCICPSVIPCLEDLVPHYGMYSKTHVPSLELASWSMCPTTNNLKSKAYLLQLLNLYTGTLFLTILSITLKQACHSYWTWTTLPASHNNWAWILVWSCLKYWLCTLKSVFDHWSPQSRVMFCQY